MHVLEGLHSHACPGGASLPSDPPPFVAGCRPGAPAHRTYLGLAHTSSLKWHGARPWHAQAAGRSLPKRAGQQARASMASLPCMSWRGFAPIHVLEGSLPCMSWRGFTPMHVLEGLRSHACPGGASLNFDCTKVAATTLDCTKVACIDNSASWSTCPAVHARPVSGTRIGLRTWARTELLPRRSV